MRLTAEEVILHCKSIFAKHGIPEEVITDNGPQFIAESFSKFSHDYQFRHITSSPYYPISNGEAERAVGTIKSILKKAEDQYLALLAYRVTPLPNGHSPSQLLMGRILRSTLPTCRESRKPKIPDYKLLVTKERQLRQKQKENYDRRHGVKELPSLLPGDLVWVTDRQEEGTVQEQVGPRSYGVKTSAGSFRRNRRSLTSLPQSNESSQNESEESVQPDSTPLSTAQTLRRSTRITSRPDRYDPSAF